MHAHSFASRVRRRRGRLARRTIRSRLETGEDRVADLHLWRVGPGHHALIATLVSERPQSIATYKSRLSGVPAVSHVTIEVEQCPGPHAGVGAA